MDTLRVQHLFTLAGQILDRSTDPVATGDDLCELGAILGEAILEAYQQGLREASTDPPRDNPTFERYQAMLASLASRRTVSH